MGVNRFDGMSPIQNARGEFKPPRNDEPPQELFTQSFSQPGAMGNHQRPRIFEDEPRGEQIQPKFMNSDQMFNKKPEPERVQPQAEANLASSYNGYRSVEPMFSRVF